MAYDAGLKVGVEGNAEFKQAIRGINDELKTMDSALRLVESTYKGQMNSMEALTAKGSALQDIYDKQKDKVEALEKALKNAQEAKAKYAKQTDEVKDKLAAAESEMERLKNSTEDTTEEQKKLAAEMEDLNRQLKASEQGQIAATKSTNDWQRQLNDANVKLNNLDSELKDNKKYLAEAEQAADKCATSIDKMGKETKETAAEMDKATDSGTKLGNIFKGAFFANAAAQALKMVVGKIKEFAKAAIDAADKYGTIAEQVGLTSDRVQELEYAGIALDVSLETLTKSMARNIKSMKAAQDGTKLAVEAYEALGVSVLNADGSLRDSHVVYGEVIDALGAMTNETERDALAMQILGKSAMELNPLIKAGSERLKELSEEAQRTGAVMSEDAVNALDNLGETLERAKMRAIAFVGEGLAGIIGGSKTAADTLTDLQDSMGRQQNVLSLIERYKSLTEQLQSVNLTQEDAAVKTAELERVKQELIAASEGVIRSVDIENGTFDQQVIVLENATKSQKEYLEWKMKAVILENSGSNAVRKHAETLAKYNKALDVVNDTQERFDEIQRRIASGDTGNVWGGKYAEQLDIIGSALDAAKGKAADYADELRQLAQDASAAEQAAIYLVQNGYMPAEEAARNLGITTEQLNALMGNQAATTSVADQALVQFGVTADELLTKYGITEQALKTLDEAQLAQIQTAIEYKEKIAALGEEISALQADYNAAYAAAKESLDGTIGLWTEMDTKAKTTVEEVKAALQSQIDWLASYNKNLSDLAGRKIPGVDTTELVKSLADGSTESAGILAGLADATDEEIAAIVESLGKVEEGKQDLSGIMAEIQTDFDKRMTELEKRAERAVEEMDNAAEAGDAARATMNGYIKATRDMMSTLEATYREAARRANAAYNSTLQIQSPSRKAMWSAEMYWTGIIEQTKRMQPDIEKVYAETAMKAAKAASMLFSPTMTSSNSMTIGVNSTIYMDSEIIATATGRTQSRKNAGAARAYGV